MTLAAGVQVNQNVRLVRLLGQGGMGAVWLAEHLTLRTHVAVKFILADHTSDADALERFTREATSAAQIRSPHVVQVLDHGMFAGKPYIVMELLDGEDLAARIARAPLSLGELAPILQQIGKALTQAHAIGIVHRDIKPANVFLSTAGEELLVKLLDFGVAKVMRDGEPGYRKTQTGQIVGTPCYMSPEQVFSRGEIDLRVDLWALTVLVYEALIGALPFGGDSIGAVYVAIHDGVYHPPTAVDGAFPPALDAFFRRGFAGEPAARFGSARELCDAFGAIAAQAPAARRTSLPDVDPSDAVTEPRGGTFGGMVSTSGKRKGPRKGRLGLAVGLAAGVVCAMGISAVLVVRLVESRRGAAEAASAPATASALAEPMASATAAPTVTADPGPAPTVTPLPEGSAVPQPAPSVRGAVQIAPLPRPAGTTTGAPAHPGTPKRRDHGF